MEENDVEIKRELKWYHIAIIVLIALLLVAMVAIMFMITNIHNPIPTPIMELPNTNITTGAVMQCNDAICCHKTTYQNGTTYNNCTVDERPGVVK